MRPVLALMILVGLAIGWRWPERPAPSAPRVRPASVGRSTPADGTPPVVLQRAANGAFVALVEVNGRPIRFVVDTGATAVALREADARTAGVNFHPSRHRVIGQGASGPARGQDVVINSLTLGAARATDLPGVVLEDVPVSLLGQPFLRRFARVEISGDRMTLR